mmetsp:Transcript_54294/g.115857  ORF Transcript_54294/g.115857 Transcript_54294/m.115857 type:complete len:305 (-) Transcript_54294:193-1107(-)
MVTADLLPPPPLVDERLLGAVKTLEDDACSSSSASSSDGDQDVDTDSDGPEILEGMVRPATRRAMDDGVHPDLPHPFTLRNVRIEAPRHGEPHIDIIQTYLLISDTGGAVYDAARMMGDYLASDAMQELFAKEPVCVELGTGTGYVSIVASSLGARRVLATDNDASTLELAQSNIDANAFHSKAAETRTLWWGEAQQSSAILSELEPLCSEGTPLLVLCSDLTYPGSDLDALGAAVKQLCRGWSKGPAQALFSHPRRIARRERLFFEGLADAEASEPPLCVSRVVKFLHGERPYYIHRAAPLQP